MYFSLRITPELFIDAFHLEDIVPEAQHIIMVEEMASHLHYHILFYTDRPITTIRSRVNKLRHQPGAYCLKKQKDEIPELNKAYRYLYKGKDSKTEAIIRTSFHSQESIATFHKQYWKIHQELIEENSTTTVEKAWLYFKLNYTKDDLADLSARSIRSQIQYNRIKKNKTPLPSHTLDTYIMYILVKRTEYIEEVPLKDTIDKWYKIKQEAIEDDEW